MRIRDIFILAEDDATTFINGIPIRKKDPDHVISVVNKNFNLQASTIDEAINEGIKHLLGLDLSTMAESFMQMLLDQAKAHQVEIDPELYAQAVSKVPSLV